MERGGPPTRECAADVELGRRQEGLARFFALLGLLVVDGQQVGLVVVEEPLDDGRCGSFTSARGVRATEWPEEAEAPAPGRSIEVAQVLGDELAEATRPWGRRGVRTASKEAQRGFGRDILALAARQRAPRGQGQGRTRRVGRVGFELDVQTRRAGRRRHVVRARRGYFRAIEVIGRRWPLDTLQAWRTPPERGASWTTTPLACSEYSYSNPRCTDPQTRRFGDESPHTFSRRREARHRLDRVRSFHPASILERCWRKLLSRRPKAGRSGGILDRRRDRRRGWDGREGRRGGGGDRRRQGGGKGAVGGRLEGGRLCPTDRGVHPKAAKAFPR
jgi:hypothetical protein